MGGVVHEGGKLSPNFSPIHSPHTLPHALVSTPILDEYMHMLYCSGTLYSILRSYGVLQFHLFEHKRKF